MSGNRSILCILLMALLGCLSVEVQSAVSDAAKERLTVSRKLVKKGSFKKAIPSLERLARNKNANISREASFLLAKAYLSGTAAHQIERAEGILKKLATGSARDEWKERAILMLSAHALKTGKEERSLKLLDGLLSHDAGTPWAVLAAEQVGDIQVGRKSKPKAISSYRHALKVARYLKSYEGAYANRPLPEEVDIKRIERKLAELLKKAPLEPESTYNTAQHKRTSGDYVAAQVLYKKVITEFPKHKLAAPSGYYVGSCLLGQKKRSQAEMHWKAFIEQDPTGPWRGHAHISLGDLVLERQLDAERAEVHYKKVVTAKKADKSWKAVLPNAYERYGICLFMKGELDEAADCFSEELRLRPKRPFVGLSIPSPMKFLLELCEEGTYPVLFKDHVMKGRQPVQTAIFFASCWAECGNYEKALVMIDRVLSGDIKGASRIQKAYATFEKAEILRLSGKVKESVATSEKCIKDYGKTPVAPRAMLELAGLHFSQAKNVTGRTTCQELWRRFPRSPEAPRARYLYGYSQLLDKNRKQALKAFKELAQNYPKSWEAEQARKKLIPDIRKMLQEKKEK